MKWDELPFRADDPCDQIVEFFDKKISDDDLVSVLNALSRQGFSEIDHKPIDGDVDEAYQKSEHHVTAMRLVCVCSKRGAPNYLKVE
jgi:hypothetical protein